MGLKLSILLADSIAPTAAFRRFLSRRSRACHLRPLLRRLRPWPLWHRLRCQPFERADPRRHRNRSPTRRWWNLRRHDWRLHRRLERSIWERWQRSNQCLCYDEWYIIHQCSGRKLRYRPGRCRRCCRAFGSLWGLVRTGEKNEGEPMVPKFTKTKIEIIPFCS